MSNTKQEARAVLLTGRHHWCCAVYACDEAALLELRVGGGSGGTTSASVIRVCREHGAELANSMGRALRVPT